MARWTLALVAILLIAVAFHPMCARASEGEVEEETREEVQHEVEAESFLPGNLRGAFNRASSKARSAHKLSAAAQYAGRAASAQTQAAGAVNRMKNMRRTVKGQALGQASKLHNVAAAAQTKAAGMHQKAAEGFRDRQSRARTDSEAGRLEERAAFEEQKVREAQLAATSHQFQSNELAQQQQEVMSTSQFPAYVPPAPVQDTYTRLYANAPRAPPPVEHTLPEYVPPAPVQDTYSRLYANAPRARPAVPLPADSIYYPTTTTTSEQAPVIVEEVAPAFNDAPTEIVDEVAQPARRSVMGFRPSLDSIAEESTVRQDRLRYVPQSRARRNMRQVVQEQVGEPQQQEIVEVVDEAGRPIAEYVEPVGAPFQQ